MKIIKLRLTCLLIFIFTFNILVINVVWTTNPTSALAMDMTPIKSFNISSNHAVGVNIGSILDDENKDMRPPFYVVPLHPDEKIEFEKYISIDLDTGKIFLNSWLNNSQKKFDNFKFSALSINEGLALTVVINVLYKEDNQSSQKMDNITIKNISTILHTTISTFDKHPKTNIEEKANEKGNASCFNLNLSPHSYTVRNDNIYFDKNFFDNCYRVIATPSRPYESKNCQLKNEVESNNSIEEIYFKKFENDWSGFIMPYCNKNSLPILNFIDRIEIESKIGSYFNNIDNDIKYFDAIEVDVINNSYSYFISDTNFQTNKDSITMARKIQLNLKCKKSFKAEKIFLTLDDVTADIEENFVLISRFNKHLINSPINKILMHFNNFNHSSFFIFTTWTSSKIQNFDCINKTKQTSTEFRATTNKYDKIETTKMIKYKAKAFNFNLKFLVVSISITISSLLLVLYIAFIIIRKKTKMTKEINNQKLCFLFSNSNNLLFDKNFTTQHSSNPNLVTYPSNSSEDDEHDNVIIIESKRRVEKFFGYLFRKKNFKNFNNSGSTNTILTRSSIDKENKFKKNKKDLRVYDNRSINTMDWNLESLTGLKVNEISQYQNSFADDQLLQSNSYNSNALFAYSDSYLNQMGINMMDNLKSLMTANNEYKSQDKNRIILDSVFSIQRNDSFQTYLQNINKDDKINHPRQLQTNSSMPNKTDYMDISFCKWCSLLDWKFEYNSVTNVLEDLSQFK